MTLYLPSELAATRCTAPTGIHASGFQVELSLQMNHHHKLQYQGLLFDGVNANLIFNSITRLPDVLASHKTDISSATYLLPESRNLFIADMVALVRILSPTRLSPSCETTQITVRVTACASRQTAGIPE